MVKTMLITRPTYEPTVNYLHSFSNGPVSIWRSLKEFHVTDLEGKDATRANFESRLEKEKPKLIFLNGHGSKKNVCGHNGEVILDTKNVSLTKDSIIYAISCDALDTLGPATIKNGAKAFIGYSASFMLIKDPSRTGNPNKDKNARPFKRVCLILINALVNGFSVKKAVDITKNEYRDLIMSYSDADDDPYGDDPLIRFALTWNYEYLDFEGNPDACFA